MHFEQSRDKELALKHEKELEGSLAAVFSVWVIKLTPVTSSDILLMLSFSCSHLARTIIMDSRLMAFGAETWREVDRMFEALQSGTVTMEGEDLRLLRMRATVNSADSLVDYLIESNRSQKATIASLKKEVEARQDTEEGLRFELREQEGRLRTLRTLNESLSKTVQSLQCKDDEAYDLRVELGKLKKEKETLLATVATLTKKLRKLTAKQDLIFMLTTKLRELEVANKRRFPSLERGLEILETNMSRYGGACLRGTSPDVSGIGGASAFDLGDSAALSE